MPFFLSSLRVRLLLLVLLAVLPTLGLMLYTAADQRRLAAADAQDQTLRLLNIVSNNHDHLINETHQILNIMAQLPEVRNGNKAACSALFTRMQEQYPLYSYLGIISPGGDLLSSVPSTGAPVNLSDRPYFQRATKTRDFAIGDYRISRITGKASVHFDYPVLDETGRVQAVLFAELDTDWLDQLAAKAELPPGATLTVIDRNGTVLFRNIDAKKWVGRSMPEAPIIKTVLDQQVDKGTIEGTGIDGVTRIYAFRQLSGTAGDGDIYIYSGIPTEVVFADANRQLTRNLAGIGLVAVLVFIITWIGGNLFFLRQVNTLLGATRRLAAGDLGARTGLPYGQGELDQLVRTFDEMAGALEHLYRQNELILSSAGEGIFGLDKHGRITFINPAAARMLGYEADELINRPNHPICHRSKPDGSPYPEEECPIYMAYKDGLVHRVTDEVFWRKDGTSFPVEYVSTPIREQGELAGAVVVFKDITERKRAEKALQESEEKYRTIFETTGTATVIIEEDTIISLANIEFEELSGYSKKELEGKKSWTEFIARDDLEKMKEYHRMRRIDPKAAPRNYEFRFIDRQGNVKDIIITVDMIPGTKKSVASLLDITDRKRAEDRLQQLYSENLHQLESLSALYASAQKLGQSLDLQELAEYITRTSVEVFGVRLAWLGSAEEDGSVRVLTHFPQETKYPHQITVRWDESPQGQGPTGCAIRTGSPVIITDIAGDPNFAPWREAALDQGFCCAAGFPLISRDKTFGGLLLYSDQPGFFTPERVEFFQAYAHQAAATLENARLFKEAERRSEHLQALRNIDMAITASLDLRVTFNVILVQVTTQLGIDAAGILLLNQYTQTLEYAAGRGFRSKTIERSRLRLGEGYAGRAALKRRIVKIPNLPEAEESFARTLLLAGENFISYYGVPLIAKGQVKGVLEIFHRTPLDPDQEWLDFLETLASQAAIAIDNAALFDSLQRSNVELTLAYDATIEGWSYALDLRDKETEGHSLRVTEMTVRLARAMGISEAELVHVRRGALLHDIGKMGVPDHILLKPGPLTEEEWEIMSKHPVYAYEMLSPIAYLRPALDIPYCHHEKWDGTGYPRGLKGEQIPLVARIFAVVDVWDALSSDRPYRPAWPEDKVFEYIREQAGKHFDPKVVEVFLEIIDSEQVLDDITRYK